MIPTKEVLGIINQDSIANFNILGNYGRTQVSERISVVTQSGPCDDGKM